MDAVRLEPKYLVHTLQHLRASGWPPERAAAIHLRLSGWELCDVAAWLGQSPEAINADWQHFLTCAEPHPCQSCQLHLFPMTQAEYTASVDDHD
jgi:hypothetical protein